MRATVAIVGQSTDGRLARSRNTRTAVVDALLALIEAGDLRPTAPRIAARAGVSLRSVFQHFHDLEALFAAAADRQAERLGSLIQPIAPTAPFAERLARFVTQRARLLETLSPVRRAALLMEPFSNEVATRLRTLRGVKRAEIEQVFATELAATAPAARHDLLAALDAAASYSTWHALRVHQGLPNERARQVLAHMLTALLSEHAAAARRKYGMRPYPG